MYSDKRSDERKLAGGDGREKKLVPQAKVFLPCRAVSLSSVSYSIFFLQLFPPSYILFLSCRTVSLSSFSYPLSFLQGCISFLRIIFSFFSWSSESKIQNFSKIIRSDPFYMVSYYIKWVKTSCTYNQSLIESYFFAYYILR